MKNLFILFLLINLNSLELHAQDAISDSVVFSKHSIKVGVGLGPLMYIHYERKFLNTKFRQTSTIFGFGTAPGDQESNTPTFINLALGAYQGIGFKPFLLTFGIVPTLNFNNHITYIDVNGLIGVKYKGKKTSDWPIIVETGIMPKLYLTHISNVDFLIYVGFGIAL